MLVFKKILVFCRSKFKKGDFAKHSWLDFFKNIVYALVICNHGPPTPGEGRGIAVEMSGVFTFALSPQCGGNTRDLCYIGKKGGAMKT